MSACAHCGNSVPATAKFCGACGTPLSAPASASATATAPAPATATATGDGSLLAPLIMGFHLAVPEPHTAAEIVDLAVIAAGESLPTSLPSITVMVQGQRKPQPTVHQRKIVFATDAAKDRLVRLCDVRPGIALADVIRTWRWEMRIRLEPNTGAFPEVADAPAVIRAEVTGTVLLDGKVMAIRELALFRHLLVDGLTALDPDLVVARGRHDWDDSWWPPAQQAS